MIPIDKPCFSDGLKPPTSGKFVAMICLMDYGMDADVLPMFQEHRGRFP